MWRLCRIAILSTINLSLENNSLSLNDIVLLKMDKWLHGIESDYGDKDVLYSTIKLTTKISEEFL